MKIIEVIKSHQTTSFIKHVATLTDDKESSSVLLVFPHCPRELIPYEYTINVIAGLTLQ